MLHRRQDSRAIDTSFRRASVRYAPFSSDRALGLFGETHLRAQVHQPSPLRSPPPPASSGQQRPSLFSSRMILVPLSELVRVGRAKSEPCLELAVGVVRPALGEERFESPVWALGRPE